MSIHPEEKLRTRVRVHVHEEWFTWISWPGPVRQRRRDVRVRAGMKLKLGLGCTGMCRFAHVGQWASLTIAGVFFSGHRSHLVSCSHHQKCPSTLRNSRLTWPPALTSRGTYKPHNYFPSDDLAMVRVSKRRLDTAASACRKPFS